MKITAPLFEVFLKCPTKCHLRSLGETGSGNEYAEWVRNQNESYEREAVRRLQDAVPETERVVAPPVTENFKTAKWRLATPRMKVDANFASGPQRIGCAVRECQAQRRVDRNFQW